MEKAVQVIKDDHMPVRFNLESYPLTVRLWTEKIGEKHTLCIGIHRTGSDRLRSYFLVSGTQEDINRELNRAGIVDDLMRRLDNLILRWIQSDDDD